LEPWNLLEPLFVKYSLRGVLVNTFIKEVPEGSKVPNHNYLKRKKGIENCLY
jgi:hypothetical protein